MNEHWTTLTRRARWLEHGWQSPQLPGGLGHAPVSRQLHHGGLFQRLPTQVISARSGDRDDREVRDEKKTRKIWKVLAYTVYCIPRRTGIVCCSPD